MTEPDPGNSGGVRIGKTAVEQTAEGIAVLLVSGEHDLNTAPELRRRLDELIAGGSPVVVDLSPASFVDSSILGTILEARRQAAEAGTGFAVVQADGAPAVGRVLEITGLKAELPVHDNHEAATRQASGTSGAAA